MIFNILTLAPSNAKCNIDLGIDNVSLFISPLIAGIVSYALFSLDQIGIELQNPFSKKNLSHLPLDNICKTIDNNVKEIRHPVVITL